MDTITPVDSSELANNNEEDLSPLNTDSIMRSISLSGSTKTGSVDVVEPILPISTPSGGFDVQRVYTAFVAALREPNQLDSPIGTQDYINGYRELLKFFDQLGYVFKFVKDDVVQKLTILQAFLDRDKENPPNFDTIQQAINYETAHNLIRTNPSSNFARTLLRLHRALIFIEEFLRGLSTRPASESSVTIATNAYDSTLYYHHGFLIRTTVKVGFRALPSRKQLEEVIFHGHKADLYDQYETFIKTLKQIYDTIEHFYKEKQYLQLP